MKVCRVIAQVSHDEWKYEEHNATEDTFFSYYGDFHEVVSYVKKMVVDNKDEEA